MYVPDRNPVKWNGTFFMMSNQYCHFSCHPTPSKLTTMNWGAFSPGLSFVGTKPSGSAPAGAVVGEAVGWVLVGFAVVCVPVGLSDGLSDGRPCVVDAADVEVGCE